MDIAEDFYFRVCHEEFSNIDVYISIALLMDTFAKFEKGKGIIVSQLKPAVDAIFDLLSASHK